MSVNQQQRKAEQAQKNIAKYNADKAKLAKKKAALVKKINDANEKVLKSSSSSTVKTKLRESERASKDLGKVESDIAKMEDKISKETKKHGDAESALEKLKTKESRRQDQAAQRSANSTNRRIERLDSTLQSAVSDINDIKNLPERINVLFLASNPLDGDHLRLDEEARAIHEMIRKSEHRDSVTLESRWAVRPLDALQAINEIEPTIVHFSGHGTNMDEVVFQNEEGNAKFVSLTAIVQMMKASSEKIRLVFFNSCYSRSQAEAVVEHIQAAIGMNDSIGDDAAKVFASQFYSALGFGKSVEVAFQQAKAALMLEDIKEEHIPELFVADNINANDLYIVKPGA